MERTAILYIAERCNQSCVFCLEEDGQWTEFVDPSTQQVYDIVDRLATKGADHITFMGGETFFRKDLPKILTHAKSRGYTRIGVTTNGTVLSAPGFITKLVDAGLDFIELSIHGHTPELARRISGTGITFDRQASALDELNERGDLFTIVNTVVCRDNHEQLIDIARHVLDRYPRIDTRFKMKFVSLQGLAAARAEVAGRPLRYSEVDFVALGDFLTAREARVWFYNVPLCRLGPHAAHSHELRTLSVNEQYFDLDHRGPVEYYDSGHQLEGRVWPAESCGRCTLRAVCPGLEETYRLANGSDELSPRTDDPVALVARVLESAGADPRNAPARVAELARAPRPERFVRARTDGAIRFLRDGAAPLDVMVMPRRDGDRAFVETPRFVLSYRSDDAGGTPSEVVRALLERAADAVRAADERGADVDGAREAIIRAATSTDGWAIDRASLEPRPARKSIALPVVDGATIGSRRDA